MKCPWNLITFQSTSGVASDFKVLLKNKQVRTANKNWSSSREEANKDS